MAALQWPKRNTRLKLRGEQVGTYLGMDPFGRRHRVQVGNADPRGPVKETVWLLAPDGSCRGDGAPCEQDWLGQIAS